MGNCCLCDFGLCKNIGLRTTDTFCGTPDYLAPEVIKKAPYDKNVDWWSLGVLIFELTVGTIPFFATTNTAMYKKIAEAPLLFPSWFPSDSRDLVEQLLQRDVTKRLGYGKIDVNAIKKHQWFNDVNWKKVLKKEIDPPFHPDIDNKEDLADTTCVAEKYLNEEVNDTFVDDTSKPRMGEQKLFKGFTFRGDNAEEVKEMFSGGSISIQQRQTSDGNDDNGGGGGGKNMNYHHVLNNLSMMDGDLDLGGLQEAEDEEAEEHDEDDDEESHTQNGGD